MEVVGKRERAVKPNFMLICACKLDLQIVFLFVFSDALQEFDELIAIFAFHFVFCEIPCAKGFGKVVMMEHATPKAIN